MDEDLIPLTGQTAPPPLPPSPPHVPQRWRESESYQVLMRIPLAGVSNMFSSALTNPVDIIKVRQQLRTSPSLPGTFWAIGSQMIRTEGPLSLTRGILAGVMRESIYGTIRLGTYEFWKETWKRLSAGRLDERGLPLKVMSALTSAVVGASLANPTDLVKIRMQAPYPPGHPPPYRSTLYAFRSVYLEGGGTLLGGMRSLWRGTGPTVARGIVISVSQIVGYDQCKQTLKYGMGWGEGLRLHLAASLFAGLLCSITSNPVDVVKVRIMNDSNRQYRSILHCVGTILRNEGTTAFYKGFMMCWARLGSHTVVTYLIFERLRMWAGVRPM
ncbi:mitochondrial carrier [Dacryopinax primogenitus]|uniref:Mitochondrial carrier n=1 Tax=Dacryopinax primogenitus (strain DJM 731) TaxID=1858805 RepID=M5G9Q5_DACPD|nr:mitochondrial carrier [Dacryopinax primogenitus]EJU05015.1 mitochondrial carrier [Dacryopinax primogenitus]